MPSKSLFIGTRWNGKHAIEDAVTCGTAPPEDWVWWKKITKKTRPTWSEWETCWRSLSGMHKMDVPIHQSIRLLQYHGPHRLRGPWGWVAALLAQGKPFGEAMEAVFHLPLVWLPLLQSTTISASFLVSLSAFCERKKIHQQNMKSHLRYPIVMSVLILAVGITSTLDFVPHAQTPSKGLPPWIPYAACGFSFAIGAWMWWRLQQRHTPFFRFLELALKAGYTEHEAIQHFCHVTPKSDLLLVHQRLREGTTFHQALRGVWPDAIVDLVSLNADRLEAVTGSIADMVEEDEQEATARWLSWTQGALIIMMGLMVLWMAWTTLIPLYESLDQFSF